MSGPGQRPVRGKKYPLKHWSGPERNYDLLFEGTAAVIIVSVLIVAAALVFGSPDGGLTYPGGASSPTGAAFTARYWATSPTTDAATGKSDPNGGAADFAATVVAELNGSSVTAGYGPPFNDTAGVSQHIGRVSLAGIAHGLLGLTQPINTANDFVLGPLQAILAPNDPAVAAAVKTYEAAGGSLQEGVAADQLISDQQGKWLTAYTAALAKGTVTNGKITIAAAPATDGPVPTLVQAELDIAVNGTLDGYLASNTGGQINTNPYKATMFFSDGTLWSTVATGQGLTGTQWGVMNELSNYPGQFWLGLYALPYHIPIIGGSTNADLWVGTLIIIFGIFLQLMLPWIPGLRDIPRIIPLYKIIYRKYYRDTPAAVEPTPALRARD